MKFAAGSVVLLFSIPVFGQSLTGNAASASAEKRVESLKLFSAPGINPEQRAVPPGWTFAPPRRPIVIANSVPISKPRVCATPLLEAKPPANDGHLMPVIRPSPPPTGTRDTFAPAPVCGQSASADR
jgi:hypothetical protein